MTQVLMSKYHFYALHESLDRNKILPRIIRSDIISYMAADIKYDYQRLFSNVMWPFKNELWF